MDVHSVEEVEPVVTVVDAKPVVAVVEEEPVVEAIELLPQLVLNKQQQCTKQIIKQA